MYILSHLSAVSKKLMMTMMMMNKKMMIDNDKLLTAHALTTLIGNANDAYTRSRTLTSQLSSLPLMKVNTSARGAIIKKIN